MRLGKAGQKGMALVITLLLLVMLAVMGVSAMRMTMTNARISTSAQLSSMTFHAAESSLAITYAEMLDPTSTILPAVLDGAPVRRCQTAAQQIVAGACADAARFDSRNLLQAQSSTSLAGISSDLSLLEGAQLNGQQLLVHYRVDTTAAGEAPAQSTAAYHVQEYNLQAMTDPGALIAQTQNN